eukprot:764474-Hanusia_phi.AAC.3
MGWLKGTGRVHSLVGLDPAEIGCQIPQRKGVLMIGVVGVVANNLVGVDMTGGRNVLEQEKEL